MACPACCQISGTVSDGAYQPLVAACGHMYAAPKVIKKLVSKIVVRVSSLCPKIISAGLKLTVAAWECGFQTAVLQVTYCGMLAGGMVVLGTPVSRLVVCIGS